MWREQKYEEAEKIFLQATQADPNLADAWNGLGWSRQNLGLTQDAKTAFERCIALDPKHAGALNGLGWIAKGERKQHEAIRYWERAVAAEPQATAALAGLATAHLEMGYYDLAEKHARAWLNLDPGNEEAARVLKEAQSKRRVMNDLTPRQKLSTDLGRDARMLALKRRAHKHTAAARYRTFYEMEHVSPEVQRALEEVLWAHSLRCSPEHVVKSGAPERRAQAEETLREYSRQRDEDLRRLLGPDLAPAFIQYVDGYSYLELLGHLKADLAYCHDRDLAPDKERSLLALMWKSRGEGSSEDHPPRITAAWRADFLARARPVLDDEEYGILRDLAAQRVRDPGRDAQADTLARKRRTRMRFVEEWCRGFFEQEGLDPATRRALARLLVDDYLRQEQQPAPSPAAAPRNEAVEQLLGPERARAFLQYADGHNFARILRDLRMDLADQGLELPAPHERALMDLMWTVAREVGKTSGEERSVEENWGVEYAWRSNLLARADSFLAPEALGLLDRQLEEFYAVAEMGQKMAEQEESGSGRAAPARPGESAEALATRGWALWNERQYKEAEQVFLQAIGKNPRYADAWNGLGWARMHQKGQYEALEAFVRCRELDAQHPGALNGLGWLAREKEPLKAIEYWRRAVTAHPEATAPLKGLAGLHLDLGYPALAMKYAQDWLATEPGQVEAKQILEDARERMPQWDKLETRVMEIRLQQPRLHNAIAYYGSLIEKKINMPPEAAGLRIESIDTDLEASCLEAARGLEHALLAAGARLVPDGPGTLALEPLPRTPLRRHVDQAIELASKRAPSPRVVATAPAVGAMDVDPATSEISVTFDQDMAEGFSWTGGGADYPSGGKDPFWRDARTCVLPVILEAGRYYCVGINSKSHRGFRSQAGSPVTPSVIYFVTRSASDDVKARAHKPVVVEMSPPNGAEGVDPGIEELRVTFSVPMGSGYSWTGGGPEYPAGIKGKRPYWTEDQKTCVQPVRLEPNRSYRLGLNSFSHNNFRSAAGVPLNPVDYTFRTGDGPVTGNSVNAFNLRPAPWKSGEVLRLESPSTNGQPDHVLECEVQGEDVFRIEFRWRDRAGHVTAEQGCVTGFRNFAPSGGWVRNARGSFVTGYKKLEADVQCLAWNWDPPAASLPGLADRLITRREGDRVERSGILPIPEPIYDVAQQLHLLRRLPLKPGVAFSIPVYSAEFLLPSTCEVEVIGKGRIEAPLGTFECFEVKMSLVSGGETIRKEKVWIADDDRRYIVRHETEGRVLHLVEAGSP